MPVLFDTHCHLNHISAIDIELQSARQHSIVFFLNVSTQPSEWQTVIDFSFQPLQIIPAIGIHPWFTSEQSEKDLNLLKQLVMSYEVKVLGEIGLDYFGDYKVTKNLQLQIFEAQLSFAEAFNLSVSIHCRKAYDDLLRLLKVYKVKGVLHGFSGGAELGQQFIRLGFKLGVNSVILQDNARKYHEMVKSVGLSHLVLETDAPYLIKNNQGQMLSHLVTVGDKVSELLNLPFDVVAKQTTLNAMDAFNL